MFDRKICHVRNKYLKIKIQHCTCYININFLLQRTLRKVFSALSEKEDFSGFHLDEK